MRRLKSFSAQKKIFLLILIGNSAKSFNKFFRISIRHHTYLIWQRIVAISCELKLFLIERTHKKINHQQIFHSFVLSTTTWNEIIIQQATMKIM